MGIHAQIRRLDVVPRGVDVDRPVAIDTVQILERVVAEVDAVDVDIVDVEQQVAIRLREHRIDELDLRHHLTGSRVV